MWEDTIQEEEHVFFVHLETIKTETEIVEIPKTNKFMMMQYRYTNTW